MVSYAQNLEDVMLARALKGNSEGFYIDVGAMDPVDGSTTKHFYDLGWHGINIEPDVRFHERLFAERARDINLNVALGDKEEMREFHRFEEQGISTFHPTFFDYFHSRGHEASLLTVPVTTLKRVCEQRVARDIDFLKIDAEGWEGPILHGADWQNFRPRIMLIEATEPYSHTPRWSEWEPFLLNAGYTFVYYDGLNRFYIRNEEPELRDAFAFPPNVLDNFTPYETARLTEERDRFRIACAEIRAQKESLTETLMNRGKELEKLRQELTEVRICLGQVSQERTAERIRADAFAKEREAEQRRFDQLFQEKEEQRVRAETLLYEREFERRRADELLREKETERLRTQILFGNK